MIGQAAVLFSVGSATLWWLSDLMLRLIWQAGEERTLGVRKVVRLESGAPPR